MPQKNKVGIVKLDVLPGVTLIAYQTEQFKVGSLSFSFLLPPDRALAPARSLLLSVLRRGNRRYETLAQINKRLDELYATPYYIRNTTRGGYHLLGFGAELLDAAYLPQGEDLFGGVLDLMSEMIFHPLTDRQGLLDARYLSSEQDNARDALRSLKNHPAAYAMAQFLECFYQGEDWGQMLCGSEQEIASVTPEELTRLWRELLASAPIRLFYVGSMSATAVAERLRDRLQDELSVFGRQTDVGCPPPARPRARQSECPVRRVERELEVGQSHLILGFRSGITLRSPEFYAMMLCHEILGLSPVSRLFVHVREELGVCYSCSSEYHVDKGDVIISCGISAQNRDIAQRAILEQIEVMKAGAFTDAELSAAKRSLESSYKQIPDSTRSIVRFYDMRTMLGLEQTVEQCRRAFAALSAEDVAAAARHLCLDTVYFQRGTGKDGEGEEEESLYEE